MNAKTSLEHLLAIESIKQVKYAYLRHLDLKEWDDLAVLFTPDVTSTWSDGQHSYHGRDAVMGFLTQSLGHKRVVTKHQVHHPEIVLDAAMTSATGVWYLTDAVLNTVSRDPDKHFTIAGTAFYEDSYALTELGWRISHIGYRRVYEETTLRKADSVVSYKSRFLGDFD